AAEGERQRSVHVPGVVGAQRGIEDGAALLAVIEPQQAAGELLVAAAVRILAREGARSEQRGVAREPEPLAQRARIERCVFRRPERGQGPAVLQAREEPEREVLGATDLVDVRDLPE